MFHIRIRSRISLWIQICIFNIILHVLTRGFYPRYAPVRCASDYTYNHNLVQIPAVYTCPNISWLISSHPLLFNYHTSSTNSAYCSWHWGPATSGLSRAPSLSIIVGHIPHFISHHSCWDPSLETKVSLSPSSNLPGPTSIIFTLSGYGISKNFLAAIPIS